MMGPQIIHQQQMKEKQVIISQELLAQYTMDLGEFYVMIVTCDDTWLYHHDLEMKQLRVHDAGTSCITITQDIFFAIYNNKEWVHYERRRGAYGNYHEEIK